MFKYVAAIAFLGLVLLYPFSHRDVTVNTVEQSIVQVTGHPEEDAYSYCTGFVVAQQEVLTAAHCLAAELAVDNIPADVIKADKYYDLALLRTDTIKPALEFDNTQPQRFEPLIAIGYAFGWPSLTVLDEKMMMINFASDEDTPPAMYMQGSLIHGMSGGPIVNESGQVVAMCQQFNEGLSMGVGSMIMQTFMLGVN